MSVISKVSLVARLVLAGLVALVLTFSGVLPAASAEIGKTNYPDPRREIFSDPLDSKGVSDISEVQTTTYEETPGYIYVFVTFDARVAANDFCTGLVIDVDSDGLSDGLEDLSFSNGCSRATQDGESINIISAGSGDTGCDALFYGSGDYVGYKIAQSCIDLPKTFGLRAYVSLDWDHDSAPDFGFYDVTNPVTRDTIISTAPVPTIQGAGTVGSKLTAIPGTWDDGVKLDYKWFRQGKDVGMGIHYKITTADLGQSITVAVTGSKASYPSVTKTSIPFEIKLLRFAKSTIPTITGSNKAGSQLSAFTDAWDSGVAFSFQWLREGVIISNQTSSTYTTITDDIGKKISVRVVGTKVGYQSVTLTSSQTAVQPGSLFKTPEPTLSGGKTLTAVSGEWDSGVKLTYQWLRNGVAIMGATKASFILTSADKGKKISVRVTGSKPGYVTVVKTSGIKRISK